LSYPGAITRRTLLASVAALISSEALSAGISGGVTPQIGGGVDFGFDGGISQGGNPSPPSGFAFLQKSDGQYLLDAQGNYILVRI